jgi:hypothetical protein
MLENERHELFAQGLAGGLLDWQAYERAGFKPDTGNASRLKAKPAITERVREIMEEAFKASDLNPEWTIKRFMSMAEDAGEKGQFKTNQNRALEALSRIQGQFKADEKKEPEQGDNSTLLGHLKIIYGEEAVAALEAHAATQ